MPTNKKGGKKFKKNKKETSYNTLKKIIYPENEGIEQSFATILDPLGSRRFRLQLNPPLVCPEDFDMNEYIKPKIGHLRGSIRRNTWVRRGDIVLVSLRSFEKDKVDILLKYDETQEKKIKSEGLIMNIEGIANDHMDGFEWETSTSDIPINNTLIDANTDVNNEIDVTDI